MLSHIKWENFTIYSQTHSLCSQMNLQIIFKYSFYVPVSSYTLSLSFARAFSIMFRVYPFSSILYRRVYTVDHRYIYNSHYIAWKMYLCTDDLFSNRNCFNYTWNLIFVFFLFSFFDINVSLCSVEIFYMKLTQSVFLWLILSFFHFHFHLFLFYFFIHAVLFLCFVWRFQQHGSFVLKLLLEVLTDFL